MNSDLVLLFLSLNLSVFANQDLENGYIVNGETVVNKGEFPFQVAIFTKNSLGFFEYICGGSLIGNRTVLSAAHCFYGFDRRPEMFIVRYGTLDHQIGPTLDVIRIILCPAFRRYLYDMDLAILTLSSEFEPSEIASTIEVNADAPIPGSAILISGWGKLSADGPISNQLQKTVLQVQAQIMCEENWKGNVITDSMFCASKIGHSTCKGDSGSPAIQNGKLVGVVSWGSPECLHSQYPNVFVRVSEIYNWIQLNRI